MERDLLRDVVLKNFDEVGDLSSKVMISFKSLGFTVIVNARSPSLWEISPSWRLMQLSMLPTTLS